MNSVAPKKLDLAGYISHIKNEGGTIGNVEFRYTEGEGIGIFAGSNLSAGEVLLRVPYKLCLSVDAVLSSPLKCILEDNPGLLSYPDEVLAIALMHGIKDPNCFWSSYMSPLPKTFNTTIYWSDGELSELKNCTIFHLTQMLKRQISRDWESIHKPITEQYPELLGGVTEEDYKWALSVIYSRAVGVQRQGQYVRLIPAVIDLANHHPDAGTEAADTLNYDSTNDTLLFINATPRAAGDECYALYGTYPNSKLLYTYGFIVPDSPTQCIDMWSRVSPGVYEAAEKQRILEAHELTRYQSYDFTGTIRPNWISPALLATIRVIQANAEEMPRVERAFHGKMISVRNELATYTSLKNLVTMKMHADQADEDRNRLNKVILEHPKRLASNRLYMALTIRIEERELLQNIFSLLTTMMAELSEEGEDFVPIDGRK